MLRLLNPDPGRRCLCVTVPLDDPTSIRFRFLGLLGLERMKHEAHGSRIPSAILQAQVKPWYRTGWCFSSARLLGRLQAAVVEDMLKLLRTRLQLLQIEGTLANE